MNFGFPPEVGSSELVAGIGDARGAVVWRGYFVGLLTGSLVDEVSRPTLRAARPNPGPLVVARGAPGDRSPPPHGPAHIPVWGVRWCVRWPRSSPVRGGRGTGAIGGWGPGQGTLAADSGTYPHVTGCGFGRRGASSHIPATGCGWRRCTWD